MRKKILCLALLLCVVAACDRQPPDAVAIAEAPNGHEIERFMDCKIPFHPTKRFRALMARGVIPAKPLYLLDGEPHFVPSGAETFYGRRVILLAAFDLEDADELYVLTGHGTMPPTFTGVYVVGRKEEVEAGVPAAERRWLGFKQDTNFWLNNGKYKLPAEPESPVTSVSCWDFQTKDRADEKH